MHFGRNITYESLLSQSVSQSVFIQVLNAFSDGVFKRNVLWRNKILFKKDTEMVVLLLQVKDLIQIIVTFSVEKVMCTFLLCTRQPFERHKILCGENYIVLI